MGTPYDMLLYPELLSNEQLIIIIQERHLHVENIERMARYELIELFRKYCVPFGQRKYRDSGRGKVLNKIRRSPEPSSPVKTNGCTNNRKPHSNNFERLKPPPDIYSGHVKRIKIETNIEDKNLKRKIAFDPVAVTDSPAPKKERKPITWP